MGHFLYPFRVLFPAAEADFQETSESSELLKYVIQKHWKRFFSLSGPAPFPSSGRGARAADSCDIPVDELTPNAPKYWVNLGRDFAETGKEMFERKHAFGRLSAERVRIHMYSYAYRYDAD